MANLNVQEFSTVGLATTFTAAGATGDTFTNAGTTYMFVKNSSAAPITVTIDSIAKCDQGFDHDVNYTVPAGETAQIGPFAPGRYNNANQQVKATYSATASVTVAVVRV